MSTPTQPTSPAQTSSVNKTKVKWGIVCLVAPTVLIFFALIIYAATSFMFSSMEPAPNPIGTQCTNDPLAGVCAPASNYEEPALRTIVNIIIFLVGAVATITWLPGIIIGIILLATSKK